MLVRDSKEKTQNIRRDRCNDNYSENFGKQNVYKLELKLKIIQTILLAILLKWQNKKIIIKIIEKSRCLEICAYARVHTQAHTFFECYLLFTFLLFL